MDEVLMDTVVRKMEDLDKRSKEAEERVKNLPDHTDFLKKMHGRLLCAEKEIKDLPAKIFMPIPEIEAFTAEVRNLRQQLAIPLKQEVRQVLPQTQRHDHVSQRGHPANVNAAAGDEQLNRTRHPPAVGAT